jgi:hypothetical protein
MALLVRCFLFVFHPWHDLGILHFLTNPTRRRIMHKHLSSHIWIIEQSEKKGIIYLYYLIIIRHNSWLIVGLFVVCSNEPSHTIIFVWSTTVLILLLLVSDEERTVAETDRLLWRRKWNDSDNYLDEMIGPTGRRGRRGRKRSSRYRYTMVYTHIHSISRS